jgi:hypothetical protein
MSDTNAAPEKVVKWFFCFRQVRPPPPSQWIACGPYDNYDEAAKAREKSKAWDAEVGNAFAASSKEEAETRCKSGMTG